MLFGLENRGWSNPENAVAETFPAAGSDELEAEALVLRALVQEVHIAALLTTAAATAINAAPGALGPKALSEARSLVASFPARLEDWPSRILEAQLRSWTMQSIAGFYSLFQEARSRLLALEREAQSIGLDRASAIYLVPLATAWRLTSRHALMAVEELTSDAGFAIPESYADNTTMLDRLLRQTIAGQTPLLGSDGSIVLPALAERRRTPRRSLLQTAFIRRGNADIAVYVRDVSTGGLGLSNMPPMPVGEQIVIELACGRVLRGHVAWFDGEGAGIRFERPLRPTDPLIFG